MSSASTTFDLVIVRHPNFSDDSQKLAFKTIIRLVIPYFLITGGKLIVLILHPNEQAGAEQNNAFHYAAQYASAKKRSRGL